MWGGDNMYLNVMDMAEEAEYELTKLKGELSESQMKLVVGAVSNIIHYSEKALLKAVEEG